MPAALAIFAHPDDIEFVASGTLLHLNSAGFETHYMNLSSGDLGSISLGREEIAEMRKEEAQRAAASLGATWHPPISHDLGIFYDEAYLRKLAAVVREVAPSIVLTHSPQDYMEDHMNTCRLAVTAAFARGFPNYQTDPPVSPIDCPVTVYHAQPHMNRDPLGGFVIPSLFVDVTTRMDEKRRALAKHESQKNWLEKTQGIGSYLETMEGLAQEVAEMSGRFEFAEGWRKHLHAGFCDEGADPLRAALPRVLTSKRESEIHRHGREVIQNRSSL